MAGPPDQPRAALYYRIDPRRAIAPLLDPGAGTIAGQESLLLRRDGNAIVYLSWLRFRPDVPLPLRVLPKPGSAEASLLSTPRDGLIEGTDYRGEPVVAAARLVPGTDW